MPSELSATNSSNTFAEDVDDQQNQRVLFSEVVAVLNELGHYNRLTNTYQLNIQDHSSCLRDLIRLLRNDGQNFLVRRQMGLSNIVENDLLPIVEQHTVEIDCRVAESGKSIMDKVVRLLVDLTNPTVLHYRDQQIPKEDKHEAQIYLELQSLLANYKLAFSTHKRFWIVLSKHLTTILELDDENRQLEDDLMLERIIVLIRNVLHIPLIVSRQQIEEDTNAHDRIIEQLNHSGILDIIQFMLASKEHNQYIFHMIEIMYLIFREQDAEFLAKSVESNQSGTSQQSLASNRSLYEREIDRKEFDEARVRDRQQQIQMMDKMKADDYTRFNGSAYVVKNLKSISDRDMICHRAYSKPEKAIDLNQNKVSQRRTRNRKPMIENAGNNDSLGIKRIHRSNRQLRSILYEFCIKFLTETYNGFMFEIHSNLSRGNAQEHDETYFLWAIQFFMEFSRCRVNETPEMKYKQVYQTLSTSTFHYLQTLVDNYLEHLGQKKIFKNELTHWSKRLHCALRSYRELLYSLASLDRLNLAEASKTCHRIKSDIFTEPEYRELLLRLLQSYSEEQMSKAFLRDLIETNHVFLKMLDYHSKISYNFKVKVKKRKAKKRSKKVFAEEKVRLTPEEVWLEILDDLNTTLNGGECEEHCFAHLFNPLSKKSFEEQKLTIMQHIRQHLMDRNVSKAVSLFRQARAVYSSIDEHNTFGEAEIPVEDEMVALSGILYADLPEIPPEPTEEDGEEEDSEENIEMQEKNFSIEDTLRRYAHPNVIRSYRQLLKLYRSNSECTNHAIVRMLYRIAVNLKMVPMFYNLGYFVLFEQILDDPELKKCDSKKKPTNVMGEMAMFAYYVLHSFFKLLGRHPKISAEICFVANSRDAYAMEFGFEEEQVKQSIKQRKSNGWTEEQELELEVLYKEYKDKATKENDIVDLIQQHLIDDTKTRRQIIIQLKRMDLYEGKNSKAPAWTEEENEELRTLFERFKANTEAEIQLEESKDKETLSTTIEEFPSSQDLIAQMENGENEPTGMNEQSQPEVKKSKRQDVISRIWNHLSTRDKRNRRQLIRQLKLLNIYDHAAGKKWTEQQAQELKELFIGLFIDFKSDRSEEDSNCQTVNRENFLNKLTEAFSDKCKSRRQIIVQLKKMNFADSLRTIGLLNEKNHNLKQTVDNDESGSDNNSEQSEDGQSDDEEENYERPEPENSLDSDKAPKNVSKSKRRILIDSDSEDETANFQSVTLESKLIDSDHEDDSKKNISKSKIINSDGEDEAEILNSKTNTSKSKLIESDDEEDYEGLISKIHTSKAKIIDSDDENPDSPDSRKDQEESLQNSLDDVIQSKRKLDQANEDSEPEQEISEEKKKKRRRAVWIDSDQED